jgi:16S rRNA (guanine(966)-N(2))-methyltransferase RsmD
MGPRGQVLRPTSDRVKEALFSILGNRITGARVLDLYAGTGALGIEALSRGAAHITFVEDDRAAGRILRMNLEQCRALPSSQIEVYAGRVETFLHGDDACHALPYEIVLADPPYSVTADFVTAFQRTPAHRFADGALLIIEHGKKTALPASIGGCRLLRRYDYGDTALSLFRHSGEPVVTS